MNQREIKFRYRLMSVTEEDKITTHYYILKQIESGLIVLNHDFIKILSKDEWSGLVDKTGKDIYEGDIVRLDQWEPKVYQVFFDRGGFCFGNEGDNFYHDCKYLEECEVIGNIYENKELLPDTSSRKRTESNE